MDERQTRESVREQLQEQIRIVQAKIEIYEKELRSCEEDFVNLEESEQQVAQLNVLSEYNDHVIKSLDNSTNNIVSIKDKYVIPGFKEMLENFERTIEVSLSSLSRNNKDYISAFASLGPKIDDAKEEIT